MENEELELLRKLLHGQERLETSLDQLMESHNHLIHSHNQLTDKVDHIYTYLEEIDAKHATNHLQLMNELNEIEVDIDFLGHKEYQNEKEVFHIKKHLEIVK